MFGRENDNRPRGVMISKLAATLLTTGLLALGSDPLLLPLPPRPSDAGSGSAIVSAMALLTREVREEEIYKHVMGGNVPDFLRALVRVTDEATVGGVRHRVEYDVTPDYLAIGSNTDYVLMPMTPLLAQRLADALACSLPTQRMVDAIYRSAALKLRPEPIPPSAAMVTTQVFLDHNALVKTQRAGYVEAFPLGALVAGHKKDIIISRAIAANLKPTTPRPVVIYGWHKPDGIPIQPIYNGHSETYADYSHGARLVRNIVRVDGAPSTIAKVLADEALSALLSDEGPIAVPTYRR